MHLWVEFAFAESTRFHENLLDGLCQKALLMACPYFGEGYIMTVRNSTYPTVQELGSIFQLAIPRGLATGILFSEN